MNNASEVAAAIGMHFTMFEERDAAMRQAGGFPALARAAVAGAKIFQSELAGSISWGDEADLNQTLHNYSGRILQYMGDHGKIPSKKHLSTLAQESIYYFMQPKFGSKFSDEEYQQVIDLLTTGIEGGINYWAQIVDTEYPAGTSAKDFREGGKMQTKNDYYHWAELLPMTPGGAVIIRDLVASPDDFEHEMNDRRVSAELVKRNIARHYGEEPEGDDPEYEEHTAEEMAEWVLYRLDLNALQKAWNKLKLEHPKAYKRVIDEDYDANDGDLFIQLALLGEEIYG